MLAVSGSVEQAKGGAFDALAVRFLAVPLPAILAAMTLACLCTNPLGYRGGGFDDWHYLNAAECWVREGWCVPGTHWEARWTLVAPLAASIALFGESRIALMIVPALYALLAVLAFGQVAERLAGRGAAIVGGFLLLMTPVFALATTTINIDLIEPAFLFAAAAAWLRAVDLKSVGAALQAGLFLGLAAMTRETSLVYGALFGLWFLALPWATKRVLLCAAPIFAGVVALPMAMLGAAVGDPLLRYRLATAHTQLPSDELSPAVDRTQSPILNPDFIAGWVPSNGIDIHWLLNPVVNFVTHRQSGTVFILLLLMLAVQYHSRLLPVATLRRLTILVGALAVAWVVLAYVLCMDPKPRTGMPLLAGTALFAGALIAAAWHKGQRIIAVGAMGLAVLQAVPAIGEPASVALAEAAARPWLADHPGAVTLSENTRRHLALVPGARDLPVGADRPLRVELVWGGCALDHGLGRAIGAASLREPWFGPEPQPTDDAGYWLCLFAVPRG